MNSDRINKPPITRYSGCDRVPWEECEFSKLLLATVRSLIVVLDREGRILVFNRACEMTTGYTADEVLGRKLFDLLIPEEQREGVRRVFDALSMGMFPNAYQNDWIRKDGRHCFIRWSNTAIPDETGQVAYIVGTGIDETERLIAESQAQANLASLQASEERLRVVFEEAPVGLALADRSGAWVSANEGFPRSACCSPDGAGHTGAGMENGWRYPLVIRSYRTSPAAKSRNRGLCARRGRVYRCRRGHNGQDHCRTAETCHGTADPPQHEIREPGRTGRRHRS